jgi:quinol monooxygenase YgiN
MYGLIGKFRALPGRRDDLVALMKSGSAPMPGCISYVLATDPADPDLIWITEVWASQAHHAASVEIPAIAESIRQAMPLIAGFEMHHEITPVDVFQPR